MLPGTFTSDNADYGNITKKKPGASLWSQETGFKAPPGTTNDKSTCESEGVVKSRGKSGFWRRASFSGQRVGSRSHKRHPSRSRVIQKNLK